MTERPDWQKHVIQEFNELETKLVALNTYMFVNTEQFNKLDQTNKELLERQFDIMLAYRNILEDRMNLWT